METSTSRQLLCFLRLTFFFSVILPRTNCLRFHSSIFVVKSCSFFVRSSSREQLFGPYSLSESKKLPFFQNLKIALFCCKKSFFFSQQYVVFFSEQFHYCFFVYTQKRNRLFVLKCVFFKEGWHSLKISS